MVKHSLISVTHKHKHAHTAVSRCQHEVSHKKWLTTNGIFHVSDDPHCIYVCVCVYVVYLCRMSHPPAPDQQGRSSWRNQKCWCTGLRNTGWCPHTRSHLHWHMHRRHQDDTSTNYWVSFSNLPKFSHMDDKFPDHSKQARGSTQHLIILLNWKKKTHQWPQWAAHCTVPSHKSPLGATVKPGSQAMQEKEPTILVQTPMGQTPRVWHSSMSETE